jgi:hypothetical protein
MMMMWETCRLLISKDEDEGERVEEVNRDLENAAECNRNSMDMNDM